MSREQDHPSERADERTAARGLREPADPRVRAALAQQAPAALVIAVLGAEVKG